MSDRLAPIRTCYDCVHLPVCRYSLAAPVNFSKHPPMQDDAIAAYLVGVATVTATACDCYFSEPSDA